MVGRTGLVWLGIFVGACANGGVETAGGKSEEAPETTALACGPNDPCEDGECHNGVCAPRCSTDDDCEEGTFCDADDTGLCHPNEVTICPDTPCATSQFCASGMCSTQAAPMCLRSPFDPGDGCEAESLCMVNLFVNDEPLGVEACYSFPPCPPSYECPVGPFGSVCSFGVIEGKEPMCVPGMCLSADNCPEGFSCLRSDHTPTHGYCSDGRVGASCYAGPDCQSGVCEGLPGGYLGKCH